MLQRHWREKGVQNLNAPMQKWRQRYLGSNELPYFRAEIDGQESILSISAEKAKDRCRLFSCMAGPPHSCRCKGFFRFLSHPESHGEDGVILPDAFDIIVPSLPGHGFSDRPSQSDVPSLALPISLPSLWPPRRSSGLIAGPSSCAGQICKKAGHFREWEEQQLLAKDIRTFFRLFRFR
jgi:hypothetical protein